MGFDWHGVFSQFPKPPVLVGAGNNSSLPSGARLPNFVASCGAASILAIAIIWRSGSATSVNYFDFIVPGIFIIVGAISYVVCQRFIRDRSA